MKYNYSEFYAHPKKVNFESAKKHMIIRYKELIVPYEKAIKIKYGSNENLLFRWEFDFSPYSLVEQKTQYKIIGDGVALGTIAKKATPEWHRGFPTIEEVMNNYEIYGITCFVGYWNYFRLSKNEYEKYVKDDPYNIGPDYFFDDSIPKDIRLSIAYGLNPISKMDKYLIEKKINARRRGEHDRWCSYWYEGV